MEMAVSRQNLERQVGFDAFMSAILPVTGGKLLISGFGPSQANGTASLMGLDQHQPSHRSHPEILNDRDGRHGELKYGTQAGATDFFFTQDSAEDANG